MTRKKDIPPPPATGGSHTWDDKTGRWVTTDETIQPWDATHPGNAPAAPSAPPPETPVKEA